MNARLASRTLLVLLMASACAVCQQIAGATPDGAAIFQQRCSKCHGDRGQGVDAFITFAGPNIQAVHNAGDVMMAMEVGPSHMPKFASVLTTPEMRAVADYVTQKLAIIHLPKGDLGSGGELFRVYCAPCHRTAVRGGGLVYAGMNAPALTGKSKAILAGAIRWGPGDMPAFPNSVLDDKQVASIVEYIQFVQHPPSPGGSPMQWYGPTAEGFAAWIVLFAIIAVTGWIEKGGKG